MKMMLRGLAKPRGLKGDEKSTGAGWNGGKVSIAFSSALPELKKHLILAVRGATARVDFV